MQISERVEGVRQWLREFGYTGERRALALLPLSIFGLLYLILSLNAQPGWGPALFGLSLAYLLAFFALAAGWFWARWFASGLGWSGFMVGVMALVMFGWQPALGIYASLHALVVVALMGPKMSEVYELRPAWRERYSMDEFGVARLGKAVTRGAGALPTLILWALAPREGDAGGFGDFTLEFVSAQQAFAAALSLGFLVVGFIGLVRFRSYAVLALGAATIAAIAGAFLGRPGMNLLFTGQGLSDAGLSAPVFLVSPIMAIALLTGATLPFVRPLYRYLTSKR